MKTFHRFLTVFGLLLLSVSAQARDLREDEPCLCGVVRGEEGACVNFCDLESRDEARGIVEDDDEVCLHGVAAPGECRGVR